MVRKHPEFVTAICDQCRREFTKPYRQMRKYTGRFCSAPCASAWRRGRATPGFVTPKSDKTLRVRANGLVNKRLRLGWFEKPIGCMCCGAGKKLEAHHPDYEKPGEVLWLCRSCHMRAHHAPSLIAGLVAMDTANGHVSRILNPFHAGLRMVSGEGGGR